ncbi:MAG: 1-phosphofructokinase, partial [Lactobacillus iners]|nr:1-phosphofructokinase [Lactobacillus iners]
MTKDVIESFKVGMACGAATAFTEDIAIKEQIDAIYPQIGVETII